MLTDSGTVQEECAIFRVPVITIRDTTERPETIEAGSNIVSSTDPAAITAAVTYLRDATNPNDWSPPPEYMVHNVSAKIVRILLSNVDGLIRR